jgi:hypothetical protein
MTDGELIEEFMRTTLGEEGTLLEIALVTWPHPHWPELRWEPFHNWSGTPSPAEVAGVQQLALSDSRYFRECKRCDERFNTGQMYDEQTCHDCANRHFGVVY